MAGEPAALGSPGATHRPAAALGAAPAMRQAEAVLRIHADRAQTAKREVRLLSRFTGANPHVAIVGVPSLPFDVSDLEALRATSASEWKALFDAYAPRFDRGLEASIGGAIEVGPEVPLVVTEGNYLLAESGAWTVRARKSRAPSKPNWRNRICTCWVDVRATG